MCCLFLRIVSVGGDGMLMQVYMAYIKRFAKDEEMNLDDSLAEIKVPPLPIGIIPAGKYAWICLYWKITTSCATLNENNG